MAAIATRAVATLAAGCFWGVELTFQKTAGVIATEVGRFASLSPSEDISPSLPEPIHIRLQVGYTGGLSDFKNPTYQQICTGKTEHAEGVRVEYDPEQVT